MLSGVQEQADDREGIGVARQERPVDPAGGPLQAFAYGLRKVRTEAGNPTYRALAKTAGYSPTTLSEAAAGVRKPTLEVVLAYVGACGGDVEEWSARWHELDGALRDATLRDAALRDAPASQPAPVESAAADPPAPAPAPSGPARRWWRRPLPVATVAATVVAAGVGAAMWWPDRSPATPASAAGSCPKRAAHPAFTGQTYGGGAHVRAGATRDDRVLFTIPTNCTVGFTGYCIGDKVHDATGGIPDIRWFTLPDGNVVSSAVIHGNPPVTLRPSTCRHDRPGPTAIALSITADGRQPVGVTLHAAGTGLDMVGFTVGYTTPGDPGPRRWHEIGFTDSAATAFATPWKADQPAAHGIYLVAAAACFGGDGPTGLVDVRTVQDKTFTVLPDRPALSAQELSDAARSACQYPG
jgi:hypothetical protein